MRASCANANAVRKAIALYHKGTKDTKKNFVSLVPLW